jgi:periplasmic copper chaperone A
MKYSVIGLICLIALALAACGGSNTEIIQVEDAWVRAAAMPEMDMNSNSSMPSSGHTDGGNSAAYMLLRNSGKETDRLVSATSDVAESVEMHVSQTENDVTTMRPVEFIEVPAGGETELKPGGLHIMLIGLKHELKPGDTVKLTLRFEKAGAVSVEAEVRAP